MCLSMRPRTYLLAVAATISSGWLLAASAQARDELLPGDYSGKANGIKATVTVDDFGDGTLAPYAAGSSIMFDPARAVAALRHYHDLKAPDGSPLVWNDPAINNGFGFRDAFNAGTGWVARDFVSIDQGPLILAIENARTGLLWRVFHEHPIVRAGVERLRLGHPPAGK